MLGVFPRWYTSIGLFVVVPWPSFIWKLLHLYEANQAWDRVPLPCHRWASSLGELLLTSLYCKIFMFSFKTTSENDDEWGGRIFFFLRNGPPCERLMSLKFLFAHQVDIFFYSAERWLITPCLYLGFLSQRPDLCAWKTSTRLDD